MISDLDRFCQLRQKANPPDTTTRFVPEGSEPRICPAGRKFLVASSAAGAAHLCLHAVGVGRLLLRDLPEHHASVAQPLELVSLMDLSEQV